MNFEGWRALFVAVGAVAVYDFVFWGKMLRRGHKLVDVAIWKLVPDVIAVFAGYAIFRNIGLGWGLLVFLVVCLLIKLEVEQIWDRVARWQRYRGKREAREGFVIVPKGQVLVRRLTFGQSDNVEYPVIGDQRGPGLSLYGQGQEFELTPEKASSVVDNMLAAGDTVRVVARWRFRATNCEWLVYNRDGRPHLQLLRSSAQE